jgi:hypothetical protein
LGGGIPRIASALGDLGYKGEQDIVTVAFKKPEGGELADTQKA